MSKRTVAHLHVNFARKQDLKGKRKKYNLNAILITIKKLISNFKNNKNIFMATVLIFILKLSFLAFFANKFVYYSYIYIYIKK